jgi:hypothetical protein
VDKAGDSYCQDCKLLAHFIRKRCFTIMVINLCGSRCITDWVDASGAHVSRIFGWVCVVGFEEHVLRLSTSPIYPSSLELSLSQGSQMA